MAHAKPSIRKSTKIVGKVPAPRAKSGERYKMLTVDMRESIALVMLARPDVHNALNATVDAKEGVAAFLEKRLPAWVPAALRTL